MHFAWEHTQSHTRARTHAERFSHVIDWLLGSRVVCCAFVRRGEQEVNGWLEECSRRYWLIWRVNKPMSPLVYNRLLGKPCVKIKCAYYTVLHKASFYASLSYHKLYILGDNTLCQTERMSSRHFCFSSKTGFLSIYCIVVLSLCLPKQTLRASKLGSWTTSLLLMFKLNNFIWLVSRVLRFCCTCTLFTLCQWNKILKQWKCFIREVLITFG